MPSRTLPSNPDAIDVALPHVLLVSDDPELHLRLSATPHGHGLTLDATPLTGGTSPLRANGHRAAVIDLRRHTARGLAALEGLRHHACALPLLALVARGCTTTPVQALDHGADDFCCGGDDAHELLLRVNRLIQRRCAPVPGERLRVGDLELDAVARTVRQSGAPVDLSSRQFDLLHVLMRHPGEVLTREQIEARLPAGSRERGSNVVEVHVHHLRRKIGPDRLSTIRGRGYLLRCERTGSNATESTLRE